MSWVRKVGEPRVPETQSANWQRLGGSGGGEVRWEGEWESQGIWGTPGEEAKGLCFSNF